MRHFNHLRSAIHDGNTASAHFVINFASRFVKSNSSENICTVKSFLPGALSDKPLCPNKETAETRLRKALLENYDYNIRPVCTYNKTITISVRMILKSFTYVSINFKSICKCKKIYF